MEKIVKPARIAFCLGLAGMVSPQFVYQVFVGNFFPAWPHLPLAALWTCLFTALVIAACAAMVFEIRARTAALLLGGFLLAVYVFGYFPYELLVAQYNNYLGTWADGLKEPALAGGAFVVAGSLPAGSRGQSSAVLRFLEKLIPFGPFLFCTTMVLYGICHFLYPRPISGLVPGWMPGHLFWTYFGGTALILSGIAIMLKIKLKITAFLLGLMIFIWLLIIHIPLAIGNPFGNKSDYLISAFSALSFCATAFIISGIKSQASFSAYPHNK
jgi:uncharacterized membrane protein YphA (DoxX/SURF4 family)